MNNSVTALKIAFASTIAFINPVKRKNFFVRNSNVTYNYHTLTRRCQLKLCKFVRTAKSDIGVCESMYSKRVYLWLAANGLRNQVAKQIYYKKQITEIEMLELMQYIQEYKGFFNKIVFHMIKFWSSRIRILINYLQLLKIILFMIILYIIVKIHVSTNY